MNWERQKILDEAVLKTVRSEEEIDRHVFAHFEPFPEIKEEWPTTYMCQPIDDIELSAEGSIAFMKELEKPNPEAHEMLKRIREKYKDTNLEDLIDE